MMPTTPSPAGLPSRGPTDLPITTAPRPWDGAAHIGVRRRAGRWLIPVLVVIDGLAVVSAMGCAYILRFKVGTPFLEIPQHDLHFYSTVVFCSLPAWIAIFAIYGLFAAAMRDKVLGSASAMAWMRRTFAAAFVALGARLALTER